MSFFGFKAENLTEFQKNFSRDKKRRFSGYIASMPKAVLCESIKKSRLSGCIASMPKAVLPKSMKMSLVY